MQILTPRLIEAYQSVSRHIAPVEVHEADDYLRLETTMGRSVVENLDYESLERAMSLLAPQPQKVYFDVSALPSHQIVPGEPTWRDGLRTYLSDARALEEEWTARLSVTLDKTWFVEEAHLDTARFSVVAICRLSTLLHNRQLPVQDQLHALFPDGHKKTVFVVLDSEMFCDGPFLCLTDWAHIRNVSYSIEAFTRSTERAEMVHQECSWQGVDRVYLPDFLDITHTVGESPELSGWLLSLKGALGLFAIANVTQVEGAQARLTFWGINKRQIALNGTGPLSQSAAESSDALYSWVYRDVPHPNAALRISRHLLAQQLGPDPESNVGALEALLPDALASAKANYAAFVQEKLKDFFELGREISRYTDSAAEYLYRMLGDLNESLRKSVFTTLGVIGGTLLSTTAVQLNPMTYTLVLVGYGAFLFFFNVWYLPRVTTMEFSEHLRHFRARIEPYRDFLNPDQRREVFEEVPVRNGRRFAKTRKLVRIVTGALAGVVLCFSGFDVPRVAKSFVFTPTWALGRTISWLLRCAGRYLWS
jgi:hypothetical protein